MLDFKRQIEKLETDAAECDLIAKLAVDDVKRDAFTKLAQQYIAMAGSMRRSLQTFSDDRGYHDFIEKLKGHNLSAPQIRNSDTK